MMGEKDSLRKVILVELILVIKCCVVYRSAVLVNCDCVLLCS